MEPIIFNRTYHRELWGWLAEHPTKEKLDWPGWKFNGGEHEYAVCGCFACDAAAAYDLAHNGFSGPSCNHCPLCEYGDDNCLDGLFYNWQNSKDYEEKSKLALIIRDLPMRNIPGMVAM